MSASWERFRSRRSSRASEGSGERRLRIENLEPRQLLSVAPSMVVDANDADAHFSLQAQGLTPVGDWLYFSGRHGGANAGLWRSDGTPAGTALVKETVSPALGIGAPYNLANVSGTLFFWTAGNGGLVLWTSNGTESGTTPIKQFAAESPSPFGNFVKWQEVNGEYYFAANDGVSGSELWKSDGTTAGTVQVADIFAGAAGSSPRPLTTLNGILYFSADSGGASSELWRSDGTAAGTIQVMELPGTSNYFDQVTPTGDRFFFGFNDGSHGEELWTSDGTAAGTAMVKEIRAGWYGSQIAQLVNLNGVLYFAANAGGHMEMWRSDGTEAGTQRVDSSRVLSPTRMTNVDGTLFFIRYGKELWKSDGSASGTTFVAKPTESAIGYLVNAGGVLYFGDAQYYDPEYGTRPSLWKTDGTAEGTRRIKEISFGVNSTIFTTMAAIGESLYFAAEDPANGSEQLWRTEGGTGTGVELLNASAAGNLSGNPTHFTIVGDWMYFISRSSTHWTSLWKTDGTNAVLVKNLRPAPNEFYSRKPIEMIDVDGTLFFTASDGEHGYELWKSDGTPEGTLMVKDINVSYQGVTSDPPKMLTNVNGELFFFASEYGAYEPWKSDGTPQGTVRQFMPGGFGTKRLISFHDKLYCTILPYLTTSLWKTDGTFGGSTQISPPNVALDNSYGAELAVAGDLMYFLANDGVAGMELWKSDGTAAGTSIVKDITPGPASSSIWGLTNVNGNLYFTSDNGTKLWRTNGDEAVTTLVATLPSLSGLFFDATKIVETQGNVYFLATSNSTFEGSTILLWKIGEGAAVPSLIAEFKISYSYQRPLIAVDNQLYLLVKNPLGQLAFWRVDESDPSPALQVVETLGVDFDAGFKVFNSNIYANATDGVHGIEPWRLLGAALPAGDYTDDGIVDGGDFLAWQRAFGSSDPSSDGDGDGTVGGGDLDVWKENFGVPESLAPTSAVSAAGAALVAEEEVGDEGRVASPRVAPEIPPLAPPFEGGGSKSRRETARDALFATGDFSRLFALDGNEASETALRRRGRAPLARRG